MSPHVSAAPKFLLKRREPGRWVVAPGVETSPGLERARYVVEWIEKNLWIVPKGGKKRRLTLNPPQQRLHQYVAWCWHHKLPVQVLVPKARQEGVSTYVQALIFALTLLNERQGEAFRASTIAHVEDSALTIFRMSRMFQKLLPEEWRQQLDSKQQGQLEWEGGNRIRVGTARAGDAVERGATLNAIHGSEVAYWAAAGANPDLVWSAAIGALQDDEHAVLFLESTANGRDPFFFRLFEEATDSPPRNTWRVIFLPWHLHPDYTMPWAEYRKQRLAMGWDAELLPEQFVPTAEEVELREYLAGVVVAPGEEWYRYRVELTDDQLVWRRHTIEKKYNGRVEDFQRENPSTVEEAFRASMRGMFSAETIEHYWNESTAGKVGNLVPYGASWGFEESPRGHLEVWKLPDPRADYVIGADPSEGLATGDAASAFVLDKATLEVVAEWHGRLDADKVADQLNALGRFYNTALLAVENTFDAGVARRLRKKHKYPRLYWYRDPEAKKDAPSKPGWSTNRKTRTVILNVLAAVCRDRELKCKSRGFAEEMNTFIWKPSKDVTKHKLGRWEAAQGKHDDRIMAMAIAVWITDQRLRDGRRRFETAGQAPKDEGQKAYEAFMAEQAQQEAAAASAMRGTRLVGAAPVGGPIYLGR